MRISVKVKPNSKTEKVEKISDTDFIVSVKVPPKEGKANAALIKALSKYFDIPQSMVIISKGRESKNKIVDIL